MGETGRETQQEASTPPPTQPSTVSQTEKSQTRDAALEQARKFLRDAQVQNTTPERRAEFLKSKGLSESDIEELLREVTQDAQPNQSREQSRDETIEPPIALKKEDRPPIVTYPEFLAKPPRPPPLVTVNGFLNTLYAFGGLSALVYGASRYVVEPMVAALTEARISLHESANQDLAKLVSKLESMVSEIPPTRTKDIKIVHASGGEEIDDAASSYDDPTELFHRDIGVQTSFPPSPVDTSPSEFQGPKENSTVLQTRRISSLVSSLKNLSDGLTSQTESYSDVKTVLDLLQEDVDKLNAAQTTDFVGGFSLYGAASKNEPDDEIKRAKENIRRVKGVLLSTRSFPATTR
ncbi:hypothetical protein VTK56DRAFT_756 [Thermocarpiscus australiensis]